MNPGVAVRALTSLAERSGVLVRERLVLQGEGMNITYVTHLCYISV